MGIAGAVLAWFAIETHYPHFQTSAELQAKVANINAALSAEEMQEIRRVDFENSVFACAILGAALGSLMGASEGVSRRSMGRAVLGVGCGAVFGLLFGSLGGLAGHAVYERSLREDTVGSGTLSICMHAATLGVTSLGIGLGLGFPTFNVRRILQSTLKAAIGGICAGAIYFPLAAVALPLANTERNIPDGSLNRLLWASMAPLLAGLIVAGLRPRPPAAPVASSTSQ